MQTAPDPTSFTTAIKHGYILIALSVTVLVISFAIHYIKYGSFDPLEMYYLPGSALILLLVLLDTQCTSKSKNAKSQVGDDY